MLHRGSGIPAVSPSGWVNTSEYEPTHSGSAANRPGSRELRTRDQTFIRIGRGVRYRAEGEHASEGRRCNGGPYRSGSHNHCRKRAASVFPETLMHVHPRSLSRRSLRHEGDGLPALPGGILDDVFEEKQTVGALHQRFEPHVDLRLPAVATSWCCASMSSPAPIRLAVISLRKSWSWSVGARGSTPPCTALVSEFGPRHGRSSTVLRPNR